MELCLINFRIASTLGVWNIESHACIRISFAVCKYFTIDSTGRQSSFEPMRMRRIIDTPCHQLAVLTRRPTSGVKRYDASHIYRRRWLVWPRIWNGVPRFWSQKNAAQGSPMIHVLAILGHWFPTWIECLGDFGRYRMAIAYDDRAILSRHFPRPRIPGAFG